MAPRKPRVDVCVTPKRGSRTVPHFHPIETKLSGIRVSFLPPRNSVGDKVMFTFLIIPNVPERRKWVLRDSSVYKSYVAWRRGLPRRNLWKAYVSSIVRFGKDLLLTCVYL